MTRPTLDSAARDPLHIDSAAEVERIGGAIRESLHEPLKRWGLVVAMSGGVDSSVCAALAVHAVGAQHVLGLCMPERDSDPESLELARDWAAQLGIECIVEDIGPLLDAAGCYRRRDEAIRRVVPEFRADWRCKLVLPGDRLDSGRLNITQLAVQPPGGDVRTVRLPAAEYRQIVAATNFKQRTRKMVEYYHADRLHYAVIGTPNRLEYDQGFFVKGGDGLADIKPIAHLYKTQVYQLAAHLGVPRAVTSRPPSTDTFSLPQTQEEFYFSLPATVMDRVLYARNTCAPANVVSAAVGLSSDQVTRAYGDIDRKRATTRYLHARPCLVEPISELSPD
jgi:NAD+ synthase